MLELKFLSSLEKIFPDQGELDAQPIESGIAARGERYSFQVALRSDEPGIYRVSFESDFNVRVRLVEAVPVMLPANQPDENMLRTVPGLYPDRLDELECSDRFRILPRQWRCLWVTVMVPAGAAAGTYPVRFDFHRQEYGGGWLPESAGSAVFPLEVQPFALPEQRLLVYEWFHSDCLAAYYKVESWSEEHWKIVENFIVDAVEHGINVLYTPLWTPPLDTAVGGERPTCQLLGIRFDPESGRYDFDFSRLERFLDLGEKHGVARFGMSHLFTQWGAKYTPKILVENGPIRGEARFGWKVASTSEEYAAFLRQLLPRLTALLRRRRLEKRCFFSLSDEPHIDQIETYRKLVELVKPLLDGFPTVEALSNFDFYASGLVENPVPSVNRIEPFVGKVPALWTYYCCSQEQKVPNRFIAMPSARNRVLGVLAFVYDLAGFLQWGYNFYYSQFSTRLLDPFCETDAGGAFPSGDPFMVYPGRFGEPVSSIRHEVFFEGLQDLRALRLLESRIGRDAVLALLNEGLERPLRMDDYPASASWLLGLRERIYRRLAAESSAL